MRKTFKKLLIYVLIFLTLFNFILASPTYAADYNSEIEGSIGGGIIDTIIGLLTGLVGLLTWPFRLIGLILPITVQGLMTGVAIVMAEGEFDGSDGALLTPFHIFFNKVGITDINFLNVSGASGTVGTIRTTVATWYYICRLLATGILLLILIYIGIRMAISTIASEKAIYKKALVDWITSLALVFVLHYIIMFTINFNAAIVEALHGMATSIDLKNVTLDLMGATLGAGIAAWGALVCYCMMIFQTLAFLIAYIKRMLTIGFLIIISPLISITYSIDRLGDGKSQALDAWLKEFIYNILIQPFHCILYLVFVDIALNLVTTNGSLASMIISILCMKFVWDGEKIVRKIFGFEKAGSLASAAASAAVATAAVGNLGKAAKGAATGLRKGINFFKDNGALQAVKKDAGKIGAAIKSTKVGQALGSAGQAIKNSAPVQLAGKATESVRTTARKMNESIKSRKESKKTALEEEKKMWEERAKDGGNYAKPQERDAARKEARENLDRIKKKEDAKETRKKAITGFKSGASKLGGAIKNSDTFKHFTDMKTIKAAGAVAFGATLGAMTYGAESTGALAAITMGRGGAQFAEEFLKTSTGTLKGGMEGQLVAQSKITGQGGNPQEIMDAINSVGQQGGFDSKVMDEALKECVDKIMQVARELGTKIDRSQANKVALQINAGLTSDPENFDLDKILKDAMPDSIRNDSDKLEAIKSDGGVQDYAMKVNQAKIFEQIQKSEAVGLTTKSLKISEEEIEKRVKQTLELDTSQADADLRRFESESEKATGDAQKRIDDTAQNTEKRPTTSPATGPVGGAEDEGEKES